MMKFNLLLILNTLKFPLMTNSHDEDICASGNKCQLKYGTSLKPNSNPAFYDQFFFYCISKSSLKFIDKQLYNIFYRWTIMGQNSSLFLVPNTVPPTFIVWNWVFFIVLMSVFLLKNTRLSLQNLQQQTTVFLNRNILLVLTILIYKGK